MMTDLPTCRKKSLVQATTSGSVASTHETSPAATAAMRSRTALRALTGVALLVQLVVVYAPSGGGAVPC